MQVIPKTEAKGLSSIIDNLGSSARTPAIQRCLFGKTYYRWIHFDTTVLHFARHKLKIPLLAPQTNKINKELSHEGNDANGAEDLGKFEPQHLGGKLLQPQLIQQSATNHWL